MTTRPVGEKRMDQSGWLKIKAQAERKEDFDLSMQPKHEWGYSYARLKQLADNGREVTWGKK